MLLYTLYALLPFFIGFLYFAYRTIEDRRAWWFAHAFLGGLLTLILGDVGVATIHVLEIVYFDESKYTILRVITALVIAIVLHELYRLVLDWLARRRAQRQTDDGPLDKFE